MENPPAYEPVTIDNVRNQVGLVQGWFLAKLHANDDEPLIEDEELPVKQRFPKPRLPPSGKISSPRKRPLREQQQMAKKKRKLEESGGGGKDDAKSMAKPVGKLRLEMPGAKEQPAPEPEKEEGSAFGMMSPESLDR
jgi:transcriptional activator SPT7